MDYKTALDLLIKFNLWRRDNNIPNQYDMPNPTDIGKAIDVAIKLLDSTVNCQTECCHTDRDIHIS